MSKKIWMLMLALCMVLCTVAVASAATESCAPDKHTWITTEILTPGSCTQNEIVNRKCTTCGDVESRANVGRKHDWVVTVLSAGDCTTNKIVKKTCACGVTEVENLGVQHKLEITVEAGTCFKPTWIGYKCANCEVKGDTLYQGKYADHTWVKSTKPGEFKNATCTEGGWAKMTCAKCGATKQVTYTATGHNFMTTTQIVKATCGQDGGYLVKCTRCSETKIDVIKENGKPVDPMPATQHEYSPASTDWTTVNATCQAPKYYKKTCTICGTVSDIAIPGEVKNPNAHKMALKSTVKAATCTEDGLGYYVCSLCGHDEYKIISSKTAHKLTVTRTEASTCDKAGIKYLACENCDYVTTQPVAKLPHVMVKKTFHGKCNEEEMYTAMACVNCKYVDEATKEFLGVKGDHEYELDTTDPRYIYAAPCSEMKGYDVYKCKHCGDTWGDYTYGDHSWKVSFAPEDYVEPSHGVNAGYKMVCVRCGKTGLCDEDQDGNKLPETTDPHIEITVEFVEATCRENGYRIWQCSKCGKTFKDILHLDPNNHDWKVTVLSAADCKNEINGMVRKQCKYHTDVVVDEEIYWDWDEAHNWEVKEYKAPTCKPGYELKLCTICGRWRDYDLDAVKAHEFVKMTSTATCTAPALYGEFCKACETPKDQTKYDKAVKTGKSNDKYSVVAESTKKHTETKVEVVKEATCDENGSYKYYCPDCKKTYTETIPNKGGHNYIKGAYVPATCEEGAGYKYTCSKCQDTKIIPDGTSDLGGHLPTGEVKKQDATCTTPGFDYQICARCGEKVKTATSNTYPADKKSHTWKDDKTVTAATCTTDGLKIQKCKECTATQHVIIKAAHAWDKGIVIDAGSCEKGATVKYTCTVCNDTKTVTEAVAHAWVEDLVNADGTVVYKECSVCGKREITKDWRDPADIGKNDCNTFGHKEVATAGKAPTCTEKGLTAGTKCSVCGTVLVAQKEIDVLPHNFQGPSCADCGVANPDYVEHEHKYTKSYSFNADFTKRVVTYTCECGYTYSEEEDF